MEKRSRSWVKYLTLPAPSLDNHSGDLDRLQRMLAGQAGVDKLNLDLDTARAVPGMVCRDRETRLRAVLFQDRQQTIITALESADHPVAVLGLAVDLGTTRYVLQIVDLETGKVLCTADRQNPQITVGSDILTRIHYADQSEGGERLQTLILEDLQTGIEALCRANGLDPARICNVALAGNTAMTHLFLKLPVRWLIREPYVPALNDPGLFRAADLGLRLHPWAGIYCFPNAGSYFGGDLLAGILYAGLDREEAVSLLVDVGTNAEVVLGNKEWLIGCAGAAGPALEGGVSEIGKQAKPGIIDKVRIDPATLEFQIQTIGGLPPTGICGSGFIDLAAELFRNGLLDFRGKLVPSRLPERFERHNDSPALRLVPAEASGTGRALRVAQPEFDSLIRSKAAMYTILETLMDTVGIGFEELRRFYVAGTFGQYIDPESAISIGMLPDIARETFVPLGNSSLGGATRLLQEPDVLPVILQTLERLTYLELNVNQAFMTTFSAAKFLPHTDRNKFPSVTVLTMQETS